METSVLTAFDLLSNPVIVASESGKPLFVNRSLRKLLPEHSSGSLLTYKPELHEIRTLGSRLPVQEKIDIQYPLESNWYIWTVSKAESGEIIAVGTDVTEKKRLELVQQDLRLQQKAERKEFISSLKYAQNIQAAILPDVARIRKYFQGAFVFYEPRDIVSGDFYWFYRKGDYVFIAVADCTGHGVPGAMMSMMGYSFLDNVVRRQEEVLQCSEILHEVDHEIQVVLNQHNNGARDGMDISLMRIHLKTLELQFAGAMKAGYVVRNGVLRELSASKYPLGFFDHVEKKFENTHMQLETGDNIYLFTDGITDQFGGESDKKFNKKRFKELMAFLSELPSEEQSSYLEYVFRNWKQRTQQTDDVTVLGIIV